MKDTHFFSQKLFLSIILVTIFFTFFSVTIMAVHAESEVGTPAVATTKATAKESSISSYRISVDTSDGGKIIFLFVWQIGAEWKWPWKGEYLGIVFDTPLTLQMLKFFQNGTLDFSVTYSPLYLIQYDDVNGNGLLDLKTSRVSREEVFASEIEWTHADSPRVVYSLTPVFQFIDFERGIAPMSWHWQIDSLQSQKVNINNTKTYEFSWKASAVVPSLTWSFSGNQHGPANTAVNVNFGFNLLLLPDEPQIKYDFDFSEVSWVEGSNVKLALLSAIQYQSRKSVMVYTNGGHYGFDKTWEFTSRRANISENINRAKAFITHLPDAVVDGSLRSDSVKTSFQPLFLIPTYSSVPRGVYIQGMEPDLTVRSSQWNSYVAFSHQLGLPKFSNSLSQDPIIGVETPLLISGFGFPSNGILTPQMLTATTIVVTLAVTVYWISAKRLARAQKQFWAKNPKAAFAARFVGIKFHSTSRGIMNSA